MWHKWKPKQWLYALLGSLLLISLTLHAYGNPSSQTHTLDTSIYHFHLSNDARIKFDEDTIYLGDSNGLWYWIDNNGIGFYNLEMSGSKCPSNWYIKADNTATITITKLFEDDTFECTVSATGTTTLQIYVGNKGEPDSVDVEDKECDWSYSGGVVTVTIRHSSPETVELLWSSMLTSLKGVYSVIYRSLILLGLLIMILIVGVLLWIFGWR